MGEGGREVGRESEVRSGRERVGERERESKFGIDLIKNIGPTLERDALEDGEHGQTKVIKVSNAVVWSIPSW